MVWVILLAVAVLTVTIILVILGLKLFARLDYNYVVFSVPSLSERRASTLENRPSSVHRIRHEDGTDQYEFLRRLGYQLGETLGAGAYAVVKEAYSHKLKKNVAIKIVDARGVAPKMADKFLWREIEVLKRVDHKNVIQLYEVIDSGQNIYIVMELAPNGDLLQALQKRGSISENDAKKIFKKILKGMLHCHRKGIAHRDLKLENILLTRKNDPVVTDFGFARFVDNTVSSQRTRSRTFCGSYAYAAPEILSGIPYDATKSDVWSLGVVLYSLVCGCFPYDDSKKTKLLNDTTSGVLTYPLTGARLSIQVKDLIKQMLAPNLSERITLEEAIKHPWFRGRRLSSFVKESTLSFLHIDRHGAAEN